MRVRILRLASLGRVNSGRSGDSLRLPSGTIKAALLATAIVSIAVESGPAAAERRPVAKGPSAGKIDPLPDFGPPPSWTKEEALPEPDPKHKDDPFQFLLSNSQEYLSATGVENHVEYVVQPQNQAGLQAIGTVVIPWNVDRTTLALNRVEIMRDGKSIDALSRDDISVLRRETKLEQSTLTGLRTVVLPVRGLQVGDRLKVSFTYQTKPGSIGKTEDIQDMVLGLSIGKVVRRFVLSDGLNARFSVDPSVKEFRSGEVAGGTERVFVAEKLEPPKEISFLPDRYAHKYIQVSSFGDWDEVARPLVPLFDAARKVEPNSPVSALADKIAAAHSDPRARMLAALRLVQDEVRYVAVLLGDGDYNPMKAEDVWTQRFGDCKGKTALLLALLDKIAIPAEPMLAAVKNDDGLAQRLPTLAMFDHVFVRARVGEDTYYLDGTNYGQRTLEELKQSPTHYGLPLVRETKLVTTPDIAPSAPLYETLLVWDASKGVTDELPFQATLTLRGSAAAEMRGQMIASSDRDKIIDKVKSRVNGVSNDALEYESSVSEEADGSYVFHFKGKASLDWEPVRGLKGNRFQFNQSTVSWDGEFGREEEPAKNLPVLMVFPYWERTIEKLVLPEAGRAFTLDAKPIDQTIAATRITRAVSFADGIATSVSDFRRLSRDLEPEQARAAKPLLEKVQADYAYVVSRKKLKLLD